MDKLRRIEVRLREILYQAGPHNADFLIWKLDDILLVLDDGHDSWQSQGNSKEGE